LGNKGIGNITKVQIVSRGDGNTQGRSSGEIEEVSVFLQMALVSLCTVARAAVIIPPDTAELQITAVEAVYCPWITNCNTILLIPYKQLFRTPLCLV